MPKKVPQNIDDQILAELSDSLGLGVQAIHHKLRDRISRRSLQRRLLELVTAAKLISEKKGRSTIYLLAPSALNAEVALSPSGLEVQRNVSRPLTHRTPVGYNRDFLDKYRPNDSTYLTSE